MSQPSQTDGSTTTTAPLTNPGTLNINFPNLAGNVAPPVVNAALDPDTDKRIRDLMSAKDKALAEQNALQQQYLKLQQERDAIAQDYSKKLEGATQATTDLMAKAAQAEAEKAALAAQLEQQRAFALKANALMQHPELVPYAEFIPATTDETALQEAITKFLAIRASDLAKVTPPAPPQPPAEPVSTAVIPPALRGMYPTQTTPTPPPASNAIATDIASAQAQLEAALTDLYRNPQAPDFEQRRQALIEQAGALAKQQFSA